VVPENEKAHLGKACYGALLRLILEMVLLLLIIAAVIYLHGHCWFGWFGAGRIHVVDRYYCYQAGGGQKYYVDPGEERLVFDERIMLGVKLSLNKTCYCPGLYAEVYNFKGASGRLEETYGGGKLLPQNGDITHMEGEWIRPPPGEWYWLEIRLKCPSRRDESIFIFDYATFYLRLREG
jgi:hypothetical protein